MKQDLSFRKKAASIIVPTSIQQFILATVAVFDTFMLGMVDQTSMSAVSLANQIQFLLINLIAALVTTTNVFLAQYIGKKEMDSAERYMAIGLRNCMILSAIFMLAAALIPNWLMRIFTPDAVLIEMGAEYLRYVCVSWFLYGISQILQCVMRNSGRAIQSSVICSVSIVLKILLNGVFILGWFGMPKLGILGVAVASVLYRSVEFVWTLGDFLLKGNVKLRMKNLLPAGKAKPEGESMYRMQIEFLKYMRPIVTSSALWGTGVTAYSVIIGHLGSDAVAANSLADSTKNLILCVIRGFQYSSSILVGQELGAGKLENAKRYGFKITKGSMITGIISAIVLVMSGPVILQIVDLTSHAQKYLLWMLPICALAMIGTSGNASMNEILMTGGEAKFVMRATMVAMWFICIPLGTLAAFVWHLPVIVVFFFLYLEDIIKVPVTFWHFKKCKWLQNLTIK